MPRRKEPLTTLPRRLRMAMVVREMNGADLMRATTMGAGQISNYLNGHQDPRGTQLVALARALDVSADFLLGLTDRMEAHKK